MSEPVPHIKWSVKITSLAKICCSVLKAGVVWIAWNGQPVSVFGMLLTFIRRWPSETWDRFLGVGSDSQRIYISDPDVSGGGFSLWTVRDHQVTWAGPEWKENMPGKYLNKKPFQSRGSEGHSAPNQSCSFAERKHRQLSFGIQEELHFEWQASYH